MFDYAPVARAGAAAGVEAAPGAVAASPRRARTSRIRRACSSRPRSRRCAGWSASSTPICRARCADLDDLSVLGDLADAIDRGERARSPATSNISSTEVGPKASGSFRLGRAALRREAARRRGRRRFRSRKLLDIAERELHETQEEFRRAAEPRARTAIPLETWQALKADHPPAGKLVAEARDAGGGAARRSSSARAIVSVPEHEPIRVAPTPPFYRWTFASIWCPGPFETRAVRALLLPDRRRPGLAGGAAGAAPARLQPADALGDLDARGLSGALPALPAPAAGRIAAAQEPR